MNHDPDHDSVVLNAYERHQLEAMEQRFQDDAVSHSKVVGRPEMGGLDVMWFGVVVPFSWLVAGIWLLLVGSPMGWLFLVMALISATVTAVGRDQSDTSHLRKDR